MRFGFDERARITGAGLYSRILTLTALLPAVYIFIVSGYPSVIMRGGVLPFLCDVGAASLPRAELLFLSWLYRLTSSEIVFDFVMLALALAFGVVSRRLLLGRRPRGARRLRGARRGGPRIEARPGAFQYRHRLARRYHRLYRAARLPPPHPARPAGGKEKRQVIKIHYKGVFYGP